MPTIVAGRPAGEARGGRMMPERCRALAKSGKPCAAAPLPDGLCRWHSPTWEAKRREWSAKGGAQRSNANRVRKQIPDGLLTTAELRGLMGLVLKGVIAGKLEPGVATAAANVARAMIEIAKVVEVEERIAELERAAGIGRRSG